MIRLDEKLVGSTNYRGISSYPEYYEIYLNPTYDEWKDILSKNAWEIRGLLKPNGDLYVPVLLEGETNLIHEMILSILKKEGFVNDPGTSWEVSFKTLDEFLMVYCDVAERKWPTFYPAESYSSRVSVSIQRDYYTAYQRALKMKNPKLELELE